METGYVAALWFVIISALVTPLMLGIGAILRPQKRGGKLKTQAYECGETPVGSPWAQFNIRFYIIAIIFIIFDVEVATVFPAATIYKESVLAGNGGLAFAKIFLFIALLLVGLIYSWVRGDLEWVKGIAQKQVK